MSNRYDDDDPPRRRRDDEFDDRRERRRGRRDDAMDDFDDNYQPGRRPASGDGLGLAAMIIGIASVIIALLTPFGACICPFIIIGAVLSFVGGIVAVFMGFSARSKQPSGLGLAGVITGFVAILFSLIIGGLVIFGIGFLALNAPPPPNQGQPQPFNNPRFK